MKKFSLVAVFALLLIGAFAVGCAVESDGKLSGHVDNPFPWAPSPESKPAAK